MFIHFMITAWNKIVKIGVVDCTNEANNDLCRDYEIMKYPTLRYFAPHTPHGNYGTETTKSFNAKGLRKRLIRQLLNTTAEPTWPSFAPFEGDVYKFWDNVSSVAKYGVFFLEPEPSSKEDSDEPKVLGVESILDMSAIPEVYATRVKHNSPAYQQLQDKEVAAPGIVIITRDYDIIPLSVHNSSDNTRDSRLDAVLKYLKLQGVKVPNFVEEELSFYKGGNEANDVMDVIQEEMNRPDVGDIVYQIDLETALRYSLERDAPLKSATIVGERLNALRSYVQVLSKYFPMDDKGRQFLLGLNKTLAETSEYTPVEFRSHVMDLVDKHDPFLTKSKKEAYIGCASRHPGLRGYPCALWTLFHTLTVAAEAKPHLSSGPREVLHAMQGYIKHFFSCTDCANNFEKETGNLNESVSSLNDSILYLWKTHNHVNFRLHQFPGNRTEDPDHPKIQFPSITHCPQCYTSSGDWNDTAVLAYLKAIYTKISYKAVTDSPLHTQTKREVGPPAAPLVIDTRYFNMFDISLCVMLYFVSVGILILVGLKFCLKKAHRKKNYIYDVLGKA